MDSFTSFLDYILQVIFIELLAPTPLNKMVWQIVIINTLLRKALPFYFKIQFLKFQTFSFFMVVYTMNRFSCSTLALRVPYQIIKFSRFLNLCVFHAFLGLTKQKYNLSPLFVYVLVMPLRKKGYICLDMSSHKIFTFRHVILYETIFPFIHLPTNQLDTHTNSVNTFLPTFMSAFYGHSISFDTFSSNSLVHSQPIIEIYAHYKPIVESYTHF